LWNLYGPTETTIWSTVCKIVPGPEPISIGRPVSNTQIYLLDGQLEPVPVGVPGELHIAGDGVARGYLGRADLTEAKFISNPFDKTGRFPRLYKTGDIARYRSDGTIEWLARCDHEIKLRGHRIDPGEIESTLRKHAQIREALVVARGDARERQELVAYLVCTAAPPSRENMQRFLAQKLPDYMIPSAIVVLDHFPLTPNGKIDRNALPSPASEQNPTSQTSSPPRTSTETALLAVFQEVLHREPIGVDDDFFRMGGHSLLAMQMASRIRKALRVDISLRDLFENPTVASLARCITGREIQPNTDVVPKVRNISAQRAKSLLDKLDDISDEEVETLLHQLSQPEGKL
jgi:aryl carrier-like protein